MGKVWIIVAVSLIAAGILVFVISLFGANFNFVQLFNGDFQTNTYTPGEDFDKIVLDVDTADIKFVPSTDGKCKVVCYEQSKIKHSVSVNDGVLTIKSVDSRRWYEYIGINFKTPSVTVYLPESEYASLKIDTHTGDVEIPASFAFGSIEIKGSTADVNCKASSSGLLKVELSTGDIKLENVSAGELALRVSTGKIEANSISCQGAAWIYVTTGDATLNKVTCQSFTSDGDTGDITLKNVVVDDKLSIVRSTGDVSFENSDACELSIKVSTGDVSGSLRSSKIFDVRTSTGKASYPGSTTGGLCKITTSTGDVSIVVK